MALNFTTIDLSPRTGEAVAGYPTITLDAAPFEAQIAKVAPASMVSFLTPGRGAISASPLQERDACTGAAIWTAQTTGTTIATDGAVLGGLPRWEFDGASAGLYGSLPAALTDYTIACLARADNAAGAKSLVAVGSSGTSRVMLYFSSDDIFLQHGTTDIKSSTGTTVVANTWLPVIVSYKDSTKALRIYTTTTTALVSATMTNSPPAEVVAAIGSADWGAAALLGEIALAAIWSTPIHEDATALANLVAALNGLAAL